jgi:ornithine carbamoyltransferase
MWQRFTERARRVVFFAQEEAGRLGENQVSTEHLLLGLVREDDSVAAQVLKRMDIPTARIRQEVERQITRGDGRLGADMQLTPRAKRVIDLAYDEARDIGNEYIGTEHLLLGLIREKEGLAGQILTKLGADLATAKDAVIRYQKASKLAAGVEAAAGAPTPVVSLHGRDFVAIADCSKEDLDAIFDMTRKLKSKEISAADQRKILEGKTLAMIFEKPSLRTRVSFEVGIAQLGGHAINLQPSDIQLGKRETIADGARNLERMVDIIMARTFAHSTVTELAEFARIPVINGLSDLEHPCQALADFYTILESKGKLDGLKLAFVGDGNNVAHSLMLLAAKMGTHFTLGCPEGYEPKLEVTALARKCAAETGAEIKITHYPVAAVKDADVVETDVWASMGQESEAAERAKIFEPFQVNAALMSHAKPDAIFEHCLPAHRGSEVTDEVIDSTQSVVFDEAENRLHVQKAVMAMVGG